MIKLRKQGIFYLIEGEDASRLAPQLGLKLLEKKVTEPNGNVEVAVSCGFPKSGLDKYIGKLVRLGENAAIIEDGEVVEEIFVNKEMEEEGKK